MKTQALLQALSKYKFDAAFGGARRDEEKSRAKERIYSFRDKFHQWDLKTSVLNYGIYTMPGFIKANRSGYSRCLLDGIGYLAIYPHGEYSYRTFVFCQRTSIVEIDGNLIMPDDERLPEQYRDKIRMRKVRFRTLGCWPLTGAVESEADTIEKIVEEMMTTTKSERTTRVIDFDQDASMEQKKREGYF